MPMIDTAEFLVHFVTFLAVLFPASVILVMRAKMKGRMLTALTLIMFGLLPAALYHGLESLWYWDINVLPPEGAFSHIVIDHLVTAITFLTVGAFIWWFNKRFIVPIYGAGKRE